MTLDRRLLRAVRDVTSRPATQFTNINQFIIALTQLNLYTYALYIQQLTSESRTIRYHSNPAIFFLKYACVHKDNVDKAAVSLLLYICPSKSSIRLIIPCG